MRKWKLLLAGMMSYAIVLIAIISTTNGRYPMIKFPMPENATATANANKITSSENVSDFRCQPTADTQLF